jgi:hypothetical protein
MQEKNYWHGTGMKRGNGTERQGKGGDDVTVIGKGGKKWERNII